MNLRQLEAFRATMRRGSISGAARSLHISQPSVSRLIADLEESLGFSLFTRTGHGLVSTLEARRFQQSVESMFVGLDKLRDTAEAIRTTRDETVTLGIIPIFAYAVAPEAIQAVRNDREDLHFDVSVHNTPSIIDAVLLQQIDLGVISPMQHYEGIHTLFKTSVPYLCLLPRDHWMSGTEGPVDLNEMRNEEFVTLDTAMLDRDFEDEDLMQDLRRNTRIVAQSDLAISAIARTTGLPALVDPSSARIAETLGGTVARPIRQKLTYPIEIISRGTDTLSLAANLFAEALIEQFNIWSAPNENH
ncbi:MAG: LysR family transcriptional regulator [Pseudomonadota bacterium]